jgi:Ca2+-binding EF-hand superfamily protein
VTRKWLKNTGRSNLLDFSDTQIKKLQNCFGDLDLDASGNIGVKELKAPLIHLGFVDTIEEVE